MQLRCDAIGDSCIQSACTIRSPAAGQLCCSFLVITRARLSPDPTSTHLNKYLMQLERLVACLLWLVPCTYVMMKAAALTAFPGAVRREASLQALLKDLMQRCKDRCAIRHCSDSPGQLADAAPRPQSNGLLAALCGSPADDSFLKCTHCLFS